MTNAFDPKSFVKTLSKRPGVYRMLDESGKVIYVGKARNLRNRVGSYFSGRPVSGKTMVMLDRVANIEVIVTHTENEALILENTLIKQHKPRYNVLLRDDKSYPYIYLSSQDVFPRLAFHRGAKRAKGRYFGPYPNAAAVRESLQLLQKIFPVRQCEDSFFRNRSRPCLQYQIKRCTAPCVGLVDEQTYAEDVRHVEMFLEGKSVSVIEELVARMEQAAAKLDYERAAVYRDQIANLKRVQEKQYVSAEQGNLDIVACAVTAGAACVQVFYVRNGLNLGNRVYYPQHAGDLTPAEVLAAFIPQHYLGKPTPHEILLSHELEEGPWLAAALSDASGHKVQLSSRVRGERARWVAMAQENAQRALAARLADHANHEQRVEELRKVLGLAEAPKRMECFDVSHSQGAQTVASCVVFENGLPKKSDYRRFNIRLATEGDDYAALREALTRRMRRLQEGDAPWPDVLLIDGGVGQVNIALGVLRELQVAAVTVIGVAKGPGRKPGLETMYLATQKRKFVLPANSGALHLIQHIRDEAHRFAIGAHRARRAKAQAHSSLDDIPGLGRARRRTLLNHFGGIQELARAGVEDLSSVPGISRALAQRIYDLFHFDDN